MAILLRLVRVIVLSFVFAVAFRSSDTGDSIDVARNRQPQNHHSAEFFPGTGPGGFPTISPRMRKSLCDNSLMRSVIFVPRLCRSHRRRTHAGVTPSSAAAWETVNGAGDGLMSEMVSTSQQVGKQNLGLTAWASW